MTSKILELDDQIAAKLIAGEDAGDSFWELVRARMKLNSAPPSRGRALGANEFVKSFSDVLRERLADQGYKDLFAQLGAVVLHMSLRELQKKARRMEAKDERFWRRDDKGEWVRKEYPRKLLQPDPAPAQPVKTKAYDPWAHLNDEAQFVFTISTPTFNDGSLTELARKQGVELPIFYGQECGPVKGWLLKRLLASGMKTEYLVAVVSHEKTKEKLGGSDAKDNKGKG